MKYSRKILCVFISLFVFITINAQLSTAVKDSFMKYIEEEFDNSEPSGTINIYKAIKKVKGTWTYNGRVVKNNMPPEYCQPGDILSNVNFESAFIRGNFLCTDNGYDTEQIRYDKTAFKQTRYTSAKFPVSILDDAILIFKSKKNKELRLFRVHLGNGVVQKDDDDIYEQEIHNNDFYYCIKIDNRVEFIRHPFGNEDDDNQLEHSPFNGYYFFRTNKPNISDEISTPLDFECMDSNCGSGSWYYFIPKIKAILDDENELYYLKEAIKITAPNSDLKDEKKAFRNAVLKIYLDCCTPNGTFGQSHYQYLNFSEEVEELMSTLGVDKNKWISALTEDELENLRSCYYYETAFVLNQYSLEEEPTIDDKEQFISGIESVGLSHEKALEFYNRVFVNKEDFTDVINDILAEIKCPF